MGIGQVMLAAALWGTVGVSTKLVISAGMLPQEVLGLARLAVGGPALLLLVIIIARNSLPVILALNPFWLVCFAAGCAVFQVCLFQAFVLLEVTTTVFITVCLPPVMTTAVSFLCGQRSVTPGGLVALAVAVAGIAIFTVSGFSSGGDDTRVHGLALAVLASAAFVLMTSAARRLTRSAGPLLVAGTGLTLSALILLVMLPFWRLDAISSVDQIHWELVGLILYLGIGPTALAYLLYCSGMARCRSTSLGLVASMFEPAFAALLAWLLLNERLSHSEFLGCALVMIAMLILWESERRLHHSRLGPLHTAQGPGA
jgi:drug/metabolite transporter, DME family